MNAFISYSLLDIEDYIVTNLAGELAEQGFYSTTGPYKLTPDLDDETIYKIKSAHLFIGILMHPSARSLKRKNLNQRVINEWEFANSRKVPAILLVEKSIKLDKNIENKDNVFLFDKNHPNEAIALVKKTREEAQNPLKKDMNNAAAWFLGGRVIIPLIGFLAKAHQRQKALAA